MPEQSTSEKSTSARGRTAILTVIDLSGIQEYVFGSNRLAENVGASALVEQATHLWPLALARDLAVGRKAQHNIVTGADGEWYIADEPALEANTQVAVEAIYTGGGNAVLLFADLPLARDFATRYTRRLLTDAPGLEVALVHVPVVWDSAEQSLRQVYRLVWAQLAQRKATRPRPTPLLGLGVTAACAASGLPAAGYDPLDLDRPGSAEARYRPLSAEMLGKLEDDLHRWADRRLHRLIPALRAWGFQFWYNLDTTDPDLAGRGQGAYVAVVHADGNDMGRRFLHLTQEAADDRQAVRLLRALSRLVQAGGQEALAACGAWLVKAWDEETQTLADDVKLPAAHIMPFRPLVYGGDDMTFICDGRLGLELAAHFVERFEEATARRLAAPEADELRPFVPGTAEGMTACAGVAVVKNHYPFSRAYRLSEDLVHNAKQFVRKRRLQTGERPFSALDWHLASSAFFGGVAQLRAAEYTEYRLLKAQKQTPLEPNLVMRPLRLRERGDDWRTWPRFRQVVRCFRNAPPWNNRRNKVQELRAPLRNGPTAVQQYRTAFDLPALPEFSATAHHIQATGWDNNICAYFDAVEALDFLALIDEEPDEEPDTAPDRTPVAEPSGAGANPGANPGANHG